MADHMHTTAWMVAKRSLLIYEPLSYLGRDNALRSLNRLYDTYGPSEAMSEEEKTLV